MLMVNSIMLSNSHGEISETCVSFLDISVSINGDWLTFCHMIISLIYCKFTRFFIYFLFLSDEGPTLETLVLAVHQPFYISISISRLVRSTLGLFKVKAETTELMQCYCNASISGFSLGSTPETQRHLPSVCVPWGRERSKIWYPNQKSTGKY